MWFPISVIWSVIFKNLKTSCDSEHRHSPIHHYNHVLVGIPGPVLIMTTCVPDYQYCNLKCLASPVTGQLADTPTRGLPTRGLDDSRTGHLADWSTRGLDNSRTGQVADWSTRGLDNSRTGQVANWTTRGCHRRLCVLSFPFWQPLRDRELSSPRVD